LIDYNNIRLGLNKKELDPRTLRLKSVLKTVLPIIPETFNLDNVGLKDQRMFGNNVWGDCTIAGEAHQTLRFEQYEQGKLLNISDDEVLAKYWGDQGAIQRPTRKFLCYSYPGGWSSKPDNGLDMITALKSWQKGWTCAGETYSIDAYGVIDPSNQQAVRTILYLLNGGYIALALPLSAKSQTIWDAVDDSQGGMAGSWGYHCVYLTPKVTTEGLECATWGTYQRISWTFLAKYCYQCFGVIDQIDSKESILDVDKLNSYLDAVKQS
jgi:hypothetical protein